MAKYIIEFNDEPNKDLDENAYYSCKQIPWWGVSEEIIKRLTPYTEPDRKAIEDEVWEFTRAINYMGYDDFVSCFGGKTEELVYELSYSEVKAKYEAWKQDKEEIHVGDEVEYYTPNKAKGIVIQCHVPDVHAEVDKYAVFTGTSVEYLLKEWLTKTGRIFPEMVELLERMKAE